MGARVEVVEVVPARRGADGLRARVGASTGRASSATSGPCATDWSLDVRGWAVGADAPVEHVEFSVPAGAVLAVCRATLRRPALAAERPDLPGRRARAGSTRRSARSTCRAEFELRIEARAGRWRPRAELALIRGRRARAHHVVRAAPAAADGDRPGRGQAPRSSCRCSPGIRRIAVHPPFDEEPRVATYWIDVLRALARPDELDAPDLAAGRLDGDWWLGHGETRCRAGCARSHCRSGSPGRR